MGALAPIAGLLSAAGAGVPGGGGGLGQTPPLDNFFGIDGRFLRAPAGGTALFNNVLFGASNQQVPIDFLRNGFYTGVPPIFGGTGFAGLPSRFDLFAGQPGPVGVDAVLALEQQLRGGGGAAVPQASLGGTTLGSLLGGASGAGGNRGTSAAATGGNNATGGSGTRGSALSRLSLGSLLKLLA